MGQLWGEDPDALSEGQIQWYGHPKVYRHAHVAVLLLWKKVTHYRSFNSYWQTSVYREVEEGKLEMIGSHSTHHYVYRDVKGPPFAWVNKLLRSKGIWPRKLKLKKS